jgi:hypothetical protein
MMHGQLLSSPYDILIVPIAMVLLFAVILIRMYGPGKPVTSKDADHQGPGSGARTVSR